MEKLLDRKITNPPKNARTPGENGEAYLNFAYVALNPKLHNILSDRPPLLALHVECLGFTSGPHEGKLKIQEFASSPSVNKFVDEWYTSVSSNEKTIVREFVGRGLSDLGREHGEVFDGFGSGLWASKEKRVIWWRPRENMLAIYLGSNVMPFEARSSVSVDHIVGLGISLSHKNERDCVTESFVYQRTREVPTLFMMESMIDLTAEDLVKKVRSSHGHPLERIPLVGFNGLGPGGNTVLRHIFTDMPFDGCWNLLCQVKKERSFLLGLKPENSVLSAIDCPLCS